MKKLIYENVEQTRQTAEQARKGMKILNEIICSLDDAFLENISIERLNTMLQNPPENIQLLIKEVDQNAIKTFMRVGECKEGILTVDEVKLEKLFDQYRIYAQTEGEIKFMEAYHQLIDATLKLTELLDQQIINKLNS